METTKLGQEPAFSHACANEQSHSIEHGMSKRFYAACAAMQGILANQSMVNNISQHSQKMAAIYSFEMADALLKQESK